MHYDDFFVLLTTKIIPFAKVPIFKFPNCHTFPKKFKFITNNKWFCDVWMCVLTVIHSIIFQGNKIAKNCQSTPFYSPFPDTNLTFGHTHLLLWASYDVSVAWPSGFLNGRVFDGSLEAEFPAAGGYWGSEGEAIFQ